MLSVKIDVTKLDRKRFFEGKNGAKYADLILFENRDGEDQYGNSHFVTQSCTKEERESGMKMPIIGNAKTFGGQRSHCQEKTTTRQPERKAAQSSQSQDNSDEIPF